MDATLNGPQLSLSICNTSFSTMFKLLHSSTNWQLLEKLFCNQSDYYEKYWLWKEAITNLTLFAVSKDEWHTKEDTGKSIKNGLCACMPNSTSWVEETLNSEKIKPLPLAIST